MIHIHGTWIRTPNGYLRVPPWVEICVGIGLVVSLVLIWYAAHPWIIPRVYNERIYSHSSIQHSVPDTIHYTADPISALVRRRLKNPVSMRIISTMLGPRPTAIIDINGIRRHIDEGDTVSGVVVDSIGRGVVILRNGNEINRLYM